MGGSYVKVFMTVEIGFLGDVKLCCYDQGGLQTLPKLWNIYTFQRQFEFSEMWQERAYPITQDTSAVEAVEVTQICERDPFLLLVSKSHSLSRVNKE